MKHGMLQSDRGVALLIVLLVTALLLALVFEFAYATRVSVRAAANFRDSQRAYFLARSGVNFVGKVLVDDRQQGRLQDNLEQKEWQVVPVISSGDAELRVRWEDEAGKIRLSPVGTLRRLFPVTGVSQDVAERMIERVNERGNFNLLSELHEVMSDEDYNKLIGFVTTAAVDTDKVNINTASLEALQVFTVENKSLAQQIMSRRASYPFEPDKLVSYFENYPSVSSSNFVTTSDYFKVHSHATVGEYTRQVEAVIHRSSTGFEVLSWRSL